MIGGPTTHVMTCIINCSSDDDDLVVFELLKHCLSLTEVISGSKFKHSKEECMQLLQVRIHKLKYLINHANDIFGRNLLFLNI